MNRSIPAIILMAALAAGGCAYMRRNLVEPVADFLTGGDSVVVAGPYDALWDATYAVVSRRAPIARASQKDGYLATETRMTTMRRPGNRNAMPAEVQVATRIEARFLPVHKRGDTTGASPMKLDLRVFEQHSAPPPFRAQRGAFARGRPSAEEHLVDYAGTSTRSRMREQMMLRDIAHELRIRLGAKNQ